MRLSELTLTGISEAFPSPVSVDFEALGPGLIALVGENGVGKSTLIGCIFAALFRQLPGQKRSLYDFCTNSRPEVDLTFSVEGVSYRALHKINSQARQMESYLFDGQGRPLTNGKKETFDDEIGKRIGTAQLFQATIFSNQKRTGNFLAWSAARGRNCSLRGCWALSGCGGFRRRRTSGRKTGAGRFSAWRASGEVSIN